MYSFFKGRGAIHAHCILAVTGGPTLKATNAAFKTSIDTHPTTQIGHTLLAITVRDVKRHIKKKDKEEKGLIEDEENPDNDEEMAEKNVPEEDMEIPDEEDNVEKQHPKPKARRNDHRFDFETDSDEEEAEAMEKMAEKNVPEEDMEIPDEEDKVKKQHPKPKARRIDHRFDYETDSDEEAMETEVPIDDTETPKKPERDYDKEAYDIFSKTVIAGKIVESFAVENIGISNLHPIMDPQRWKPPFGQVLNNNNNNSIQNFI